MIDNPISQIIEDIEQINIILVSEAGHGKSTSLKTISQKIKDVKPHNVFKIFDISQAWFHTAPVKYRQSVTIEKLGRNSILNIGDCVYEMGRISKDIRRKFVAWIINQDYLLRYDLAEKNGIDIINKLPPITYIFEEANTFFGSYSLRRNDPYSPILNDFISVGRNYGLRGFFVITAEVGEFSPGFRRRSTGRILGRILNEYDLREYCRGFPELRPVLKQMPKYNWIYKRGDFSEPFRILDEVKDKPTDFIMEEKKTEKTTKSERISYSKIIAACILIILLAVLMSLIVFRNFF